jgi:UDP-2,4-diacetamido-2,4,6-trideoxy-beta-L-altropyranose hydrolase
LNILFRCDGFVEIGMGHVVRCLALADHLEKNDDYFNIQFAMRQSVLGISKVKEKYQVLESNEKDFNYKEWLTDCIEKTKTKVLIMDMRDGLTRKELKAIKKKTGIKVVTIDDPEDKRLEADLAFYPPVPQLEKLNWNGFGGELYVGWEYVILRKEFLKKYPKPKNTTPNILVSMGGTDEKNMTEFVINSMKQINEKFKATIIVGSGYPYILQLKKRLEKVHFEFELLQNPKDIAKIMSQSDFSIISFGQTAYELAALNVSALYICLTDDHFESSKLFMKNGAGTSLGIFSLMKQEGLAEAIKFHLSENQVVKDMPISANILNISNLLKVSKESIDDKKV